MGLLTTYDENNRVVMNDKVVTYSQQRIYGEWTYKYGVSELITIYHVWEVHRYCAKSYMYVGMDKDTAYQCAQAMVTKYTRPFRISQWNGDGTYAGTFTTIDGGSICMADIAVQKREGCMYDVVINVREDDARLNTNPTASPASLFTTENARDYDDGTTRDTTPVTISLSRNLAQKLANGETTTEEENGIVNHIRLMTGRANDYNEMDWKE